MQKRIEKAKTERKIAEDLDGIKKAFEEQDPDALRVIFSDGVSDSSEDD